MVKNEKQYKITQRKLRELNEQIASTVNDKNKNPLRNQLIIATLNSNKKELEHELFTYESLKKSKRGILKERLISELPSMITEFKIMSGLTQKELAEQLGLKEQQLQRYEADNFKRVTFKNLLRFFDLIGLEIRIKETRMSRTNQRQSRKKNPTA
jgi:ribosome-binding protein aMBF1 (putative translation factor)